MNEINDVLSVYNNYILLGNFAFSLLLFLLLIINMTRLKNLTKKYKRFMRGENGLTLENIITDHLDKFQELEKQTLQNRKKIQFLDDKLNKTYQKMGIVKYDAFNEMGGQLSFVVALLDNHNNGLILNSMHNRDGCYNYVKEIVNGESYIVLGEEEKKALEMAINNTKK